MSTLVRDVALNYIEVETDDLVNCTKWFRGKKGVMSLCLGVSNMIIEHGGLYRKMPDIYSVYNVRSNVTE